MKQKHDSPPNVYNETIVDNISHASTEPVDSYKRIIWVDVESNGTTPFDGKVLLEVAVLVTDTDLNILDPKGYQAVVKYSAEEIATIREDTSDYVLKMHEATGLWDKLLDGKELDVIDAEMLAYMKQFVPDEKKARLAGNSITLDRNFIEKYLPDSFQHFGYRSIDVSTLAGLVEYWGTDEMQYKKKTLHSAFSDITESIEELKHLRKNSMTI